MQPAPIPSNESERLAALRRYDILDTPAEADFDDFTRLASQICGTTMATITLIDAARQWFKSRVGMEASETPRDISFCGHTISGREILEVSNALEDDRFRDNPFVTGDPNIRFYAGAPLVTPDGLNIGTLCVLDRTPRYLTPQQREMLTVLSRQVVHLLELRLAGRRVKWLNENLERAEEVMRRHNAELEQLVAERTRELQDKNAQMKEELEMARELQFALLPQKFPSIPANAPASASAVRFLSYYFPTGDVSGDFFSVFPVTEKAVGIFICDVMGHGVRAALVASMIRALVEESVYEALHPGELLMRINQGLIAILTGSGATMYATGCYLVVDVERCELRYATAGHPSPLLVSRSNQQVETLFGEGFSGPALGIFPKAEYGMERRAIANGDLIMMFTDGLFDVENSQGDMFDEQLLLAAVRCRMALPPAKFFDEVIGEARSFSAHQMFDDDVCLVGIEVRNLDPRDQVKPQTICAS